MEREPKQNLEREIHVRQDFFELIKRGQKTAEVRVGFPSFRKIKVGDKVKFKSAGGEIVTVEIDAVREYATLQDLADQENLSNIAPGIDKRRLEQMAKQIFNEADIQQHGLLVLDFHLTESK